MFTLYSWVSKGKINVHHGQKEEVILEINKVNNKIGEQLTSNYLRIKGFEENKSKLGLNNFQNVSMNLSNVSLSCNSSITDVIDDKNNTSWNQNCKAK